MGLAQTKHVSLDSSLLQQANQDLSYFHNYCALECALMREPAALFEFFVKALVYKRGIFPRVAV